MPEAQSGSENAEKIMLKPDAALWEIPRIVEQTKQLLVINKNEIEGKKLKIKNNNKKKILKKYN